MDTEKAEQYAQWIVNNPDKVGTPEFETVRAAYEAARPGATPEPEQFDMADYLKGGLTSIGQMYTGGYADEASGALQSLLPYPYGTDYESAQQSAETQFRDWEEKNPVSSLAIPIGTALATGPAGTRALLKNPRAKQVLDGLLADSKIGRWGQGLLTAGTGGAIAGYGYGDDIEDAASGALWSTALSGISPVLSTVGGYLGNKIAETGKTVIDSLSDTRRRLARKLNEMIDDDNLTPEEFERQLKELGPEGLPVDVGPNITSLGEGYATVPGPSKAAARDALETRARGSQQRIISTLVDDPSVLDMQAAKKRLEENRRVLGKQYDPLFDSVTIPLNENLENLLGRPMMKNALQQALVDARDAGETGLEQFFREGIDGTIELVERPSLRTWDRLKRTLNRKISDETDEFGKVSSAGVTALKIKTELVNELDDVSDDYKKLRRDYATEFDAEDALDLGRKVFRLQKYDAEVIKEQVEQMSDVELAHFELGALRHLRDKIISKETMSTPWKANPLLREKMEAAFGPRKSKQIIERIEKESIFNTTRSRILGGSATTGRQQAVQDAPIDSGTVVDAATGRFDNMILRQLAKSKKSIPTDMNRAAADILFNPQALQKKDVAGNPELMGLLTGWRRPNELFFDSTPQDYWSRVLSTTIPAGGLLGPEE